MPLLGTKHSSLSNKTYRSSYFLSTKNLRVGIKFIVEAQVEWQESESSTVQMDCKHVNVCLEMNMKYAVFDSIVSL